jgi:1,4-dihydroxy-2-naphthoyl-CoA hydrolase
MAIWRDGKDPMALAAATGGRRTLITTLGMELLEAGDDWLRGRMPVDERTHQPYGLLHGGASVALAETLASWAGTCAAEAGKVCVGQEINANHIRPVREGWVYGTATPEALGRTAQVWSIRITDEAGKLVCISRMTLAVVPALPA